MNPIPLALALVLTTAACVCVYLASPNQRWRASALPARPALAVSALLSVGGIAALLQTMALLPALFTFSTWSMVLLVAFPHLRGGR